MKHKDSKDGKGIKLTIKKTPRPGSAAHRVLHASSGRYAIRSDVSGYITLPNGDKIGTVRKDVLDRALGRSHPKK